MRAMANHCTVLKKAPARTPLPRVPEVTTEVGAFQLLGHLDAVPFLGGVEIHDGPFSLLGGAVHIPVSTDITTRNVLFNGGTAGLIANAGTATLLYRALEQPTQYVDLGIGFRPWAFTANLSLNPGILPGQSVTRSASWADPLGYRSVNFNYQASGGFDLGFNVHMKGPMLNATFKF